jgi:GTP-dependent dephospho-CoA kinase
MYTHLFVGGTFDQLHSGHEHLLHTALNQSESVTIGITTDVFIQKYKKDTRVRPFSERQLVIKQWVAAHYPTNTVTVIGIDDPYEPAVSGDFDALVVTEQNKKTGEEINIKRQEVHKKPLAYVEIQLVVGEDHLPISATHIREGVIDHQGKLLVPEELRPALQTPLGTVVTTEEAKTLWQQNKQAQIITVGDATSFSALAAGCTPILIIIDHKEKREPSKNEIESSVLSNYLTEWVLSGPGFIAQNAIDILNQWGKDGNPMVLVVDGEEDLLVLPAILAAPIGAFVYYGQPNVGVVEVAVTPEIKDTVKKLLKQFVVA